MANRFWVASAGTYSGNINDTAHWSTTSGGAGGSATPTASDDVFFDGVGSSGGDKTITLNASQSWRSFDMTGGGAAGIIISHTAAVIITVGAASSTGCKFEAGGTYTAAASTSTFALTNTGSVTKDFTSAGYTFGTVQINNNAGANWRLADTLAVASLTIAGGTFSTNAQTVNITTTFNNNASSTRTVTVTNSTINISAASSSTLLNNATGLTWTGTGSTFNITGNGAKTLALGASLTYGTIAQTGTGVTTVTGSSTTCANYSRIGGANLLDKDVISTSLTVTGTLTLTGNSTTNRLGFIGANAGAGITVTAAAVALTNVDIEGVTAAGAAAPFTGTSLGDATGNSNITFDSPLTLYYVGAGGSGTTTNWSNTAQWSLTSGGSGGQRVPLIQDSVIFDDNSYTDDGPNWPIVMLNVYRYGDMDYTAITGTNPPIFRFSNNVIFYGDFKLGVYQLSPGSLAWDNNLGGTITWEQMTTVDYINEMYPVGTNITVAAPGGTVRWGGSSPLPTQHHAVWNHTSGTIDTNDRDSLFRNSLTSSGSLVRAINFRSGTFQFDGVSGGTMFTASGSNLTIIPGTSTILFDPENSGGDGLTYTFAGGGLAYGNLALAHTNASNNKLTVTGANTFATISSTGKGTITLPAGSTTTATGLNLHGTDGSNLLSLVSSSGGSAATLSIASGVLSNDYLSIQDSAATGGATFYAGANSTDVSGNSGWNFSAAPAASPPPKSAGRAARAASLSGRSLAGRGLAGRHLWQ